MAKVLSIRGDVIEIGGDDGTLTEARRADFSFEPRVGDIVDIFRSENALRVVLSDKQGGYGGQNHGGPVSQSGQGININLTQSQTQPPVFMPQAVPVATAGKVVNKTAYILCAIFVGGLGVHKFISGKTGMGILYLVFCWTFIPALVAFIEGLIAIGKQADANGNIVM